MKKFLLLGPLLLLLTACPVGLDYAPDTVGAQPVDSRLVGTWYCDDEDSPAKKLEITRNNSNEFHVSVLEEGEMYAVDGHELTMYQTKIDDLTILYLQAAGDSKYFLFQLKIVDSKTMVIADVPLLDGGTDALTSVQSLRDQISRSRNRENFYANPLTYKKL